VTEADYKSEKLIVSRLKEHFPQYSILAEEEGMTEMESDYLWVIDPLDGTNNFAHRFPFFCVSIALWIDLKPAMGVVYDPLRDELFTAVKGQGAFLNDKPIHVSERGELTESIVATGFYYDRGELMHNTLRQMETFFNVPIQGIRRTGSALLDQCNVACGRLDGFWELILGPWDYASGAMIVTEAGGTVTDVKGDELDLFAKNILASNGRIHQAMLQVVKL